jgi:hypothetical protein
MWKVKKGVGVMGRDGVCQKGILRTLRGQIRVDQRDQGVYGEGEL